MTTRRVDHDTSEVGRLQRRGSGRQAKLKEFFDTPSSVMAALRHEAVPVPAGLTTFYMRTSLQSSAIPAKAALRCHSIKANRSSRADNEGVVRRHL